MTRHYLMIALLFAAGVFGLWLGITFRRSATLGSDWPTASATVLQKRAVPTGRLDYGYVEIKYRYRVGETDHYSERVHPTGRIEYSLREAQRVVDALPTPLPVHYNPDDPEFAFVLTNSTSTYFIPLALGGLCLLAAIVKLLANLGGRNA